MTKQRDDIDLRSFGVSKDRGFLPMGKDPLTVLPNSLLPLDLLGIGLPNILAEKRIKEACLDLPIPSRELLESLNERQAQLALLRYDFIKSAFVHGQKKTPKYIPRNLAWPSWILGTRLGKHKYILNYYSYSSCNWKRIDLFASLRVDNLRLIQGFMGTGDEAWFVLIHVAIDYREAALIYWVLAAIDAAKSNNFNWLKYALGCIGDIYLQMTEIFKRMGEKAFPSTYHQTRKWIQPFKKIRYQGIPGWPRSYRGETGAQRPGMQAICALLGIQHQESKLTVHLKDMLNYMPPGHRDFIKVIEERSEVREAVLKERGRLGESYNHAVEAVAGFRGVHLDHSDEFIHKQTSDPKGTGGTDFMPWLTRLRDETLEHRV